MTDPIVETDLGVTLVGGGTVADGEIAQSVARAPVLVAADGGAAHCLKAGLLPHAVIGDFDSLDEATRSKLDPATLHQVDEQDSTDFDKALRHISAPWILGSGFMGPRLDHLLACTSSLLRWPDRRVVLLGTRDLAFLCPPRIQFEAPAGSRVSLYPLAPVTGRSEGLHWPIDGLALAPGGRVGTSNRALGGQVTVSADAPALLVILPVERCAALLVALERAPEHWPARAER